MGVSLGKLGRYDEAIAAYQRQHPSTPTVTLANVRERVSGSYASGKTWNTVICLLGVMQRGNLPMFGRDHDPKGLHVTAPAQAPRAG